MFRKIILVILFGIISIDVFSVCPEKSKIDDSDSDLCEKTLQECGFLAPNNMKDLLMLILENKNKVDLRCYKKAKDLMDNYSQKTINYCNEHANTHGNDYMDCLKNGIPVSPTE